MSTDQKTLKKFLDRRHPLYAGMADHWQFLSATYEGGRAWFKPNIFRYIKEGEKEYGDRVKRAYRFNHTREVVDLVNKYLFKIEVARNEDNLPDAITAFWKEASLQCQPIKEYMRSVSTEVAKLGRVWLVVDTNKDKLDTTVAEDKEDGVRIYSYMVLPQNALDMGYDDMGELTWILFYECTRDDTDPILASGKLNDQFRLWTRDSSQVFRIERAGNRVTVVPEAERLHNLGFVPVINADNVISDEKYTSPSMIADVAYLDRACANYLSNLDAIIQDQTFSQLAMPSQGLTPETDPYKQLLEMGTKRIFIYDGGEGGNQPFFLSPDVKQAQLILQVINKIINEIYHSVGLAGERTKEDNSMGIDNSSGVAKAYDFERVNSLLAAKADSLERIENRLCEMVASYAGVEEDLDKLDKPAVLYPDDFDVRGLYDEFEIAARLALIEAPDTVRREQMSKVVDKLFPQLKKDLKDSMLAELKTWPPKLDLLDPANAGKSGSSSIQASGTKALASKLVAGTGQRAAI